jgi:hypothetical protein
MGSVRERLERQEMERKYAALEPQPAPPAPKTPEQIEQERQERLAQNAGAIKQQQWEIDLVLSNASAVECAAIKDLIAATAVQGKTNSDRVWYLLQQLRLDAEKVDECLRGVPETEKREVLRRIAELPPLEQFNCEAIQKVADDAHFDAIEKSLGEIQ